MELERATLTREAGLGLPQKDKLSNLTPRQQLLLKLIRDAVEANGYPPSMRELAERAGLASTSSVAYQLKVLEKAGFIRRNPNRPRAMVVTLPENIAPEAPEPELPEPEQTHTSRPEAVETPPFYFLSITSLIAAFTTAKLLSSISIM